MAVRGWLAMQGQVRDQMAIRGQMVVQGQVRGRIAIQGRGLVAMRGRVSNGGSEGKVGS